MLFEAIPTFDSRLGSPEYLADPYATYSLLRSEAPVYWSELWQSWLITRYEDIVSALRDHARNSNRDRQATLLSRLSAGSQSEYAGLSSHYENGGISNQDPPEHARLRGLVNLAFTPRIVSELELGIRRTVDRLLEALPEGEPVDLIGAFASPLPSLVIADLLGLPVEDRSTFTAWSNTITAFLGGGPSNHELARSGQQAMVELRAYLSEKLAERRANPTADLLSRFARAGQQEDTLTENEIIGSCVTLLMGGHETTRNLIGNGMLALLNHPDQLRLLRSDPDLIPSAIEEFLRFDAPVQRIWRVAREEIAVKGKTLRQGDSVYLMTGAANRDKTHFNEPDALDIRRTPNRHLTFGLGIHFCLGAALARLEARIAFSRLLARFARIELAKPPGYLPNFAFRGLTSLPVVLSLTGGGGTPMRRFAID